jgi:hypothetical protein
VGSEYPIIARMSSVWRGLARRLPAVPVRPIGSGMVQRETVGTGGKGGRKGDGTRADRLRAALRENLKRRKLQARGRSQAEKPAGPPHDSAGFVPEKPEG